MSDTRRRPAGRAFPFVRVIRLTGKEQNSIAIHCYMGPQRQPFNGSDAALIDHFGSSRDSVRSSDPAPLGDMTVQCFAVALGRW
jgi:hypothetical protein